MGWASGSEIYGDLMSVIQKLVPDKGARKKFHLEAIDIFESFDCDTLGELLYDDDVDPAFVEAFKKTHPD